MSSILNDIKRLIGPDVEDDSFDTELIVHINSVLADLHQLGVGPKDGFKVTDESQTWEEYLGEMIQILANVRTYMYLSVKQVFDPASSGAVSTSTENRINKLEWRICTAVETFKKEREGED